ncbi:MAG: rhomboid family intramembrane serine protease [Proteobacteria bacterium]|nr:rhomboid family intramembrane serine protease [Pseudomonadota bacterium]MBU1612080.1 rhomboid family intramembrane serine protease [Pseudomonadota bacterium]
MIPLYDNVPRVHPPLVVLGIIGLNALVFLSTISLAPQALMDLHFEWGLVPARLMHPVWASHVGYTGTGLPQLVSYMFLHGGWLHVIMNMWMLWIFADNIEDVTGHRRFVFFYLVCGLIAVLMHMAFNADSTIPIIGASGAVAGVMGAYFVLYPQGRVATLILFFVMDVPATVFLGIWFVVQVVSGLLESSAAVAGIAWWAHVGGFLSGMALIRFFVQKDRCYYCYNPEKKHYDRNE